jgi:hypothetical protein
LFCEKLLGHRFPGEEAAYTTSLSTSIKKIRERHKYDAVLIDEARPDTRNFVALKCLNPAIDIFTVALDEGQDIYGRKRDWRALGINLKGKVHNLGTSYRNTFEIASFADRFRTVAGMAPAMIIQSPATSDSTSPAAQVEQFHLFSDPPPSWAPIFDLFSIGDWWAKKIHRMTKEICRIAVIYTRRRRIRNARNLSTRMEALE